MAQERSSGILPPPLPAGGPSRTQRLLDAPILSAIARLAVPGVALAAFQVCASIAETHYVGRLGTGPLAGLALAFPLVMLLQMISAGAIGGGISSAIARALGAGDETAARSLVAHAIVIAVAAGAAGTILMLALGAPLFRLLGGRDAALAQALAYSNVLFAGSVLVWLANALASALRGSGNTLAPAVTLVLAALLQIVLGAVLTLGWGAVPARGIAGAAIAYVLAWGLAAAAMAAYLWRGDLRPHRGDWRLEARRFREILRVGAVSALSSLQTVLTVVLLTGLVSRFGAAALAGYGVGARLELLQIPVVFAIGQALVILVGINIGAGRPQRAKAIAWTGTAVAMAVSGVIALLVSVRPHAWVGIFSSDPAVLEAGSSYLRIVAPFYPAFAAGQALYFASQGAGRIVMPLLAGTARLVVVAAGGLLVFLLAGPPQALFAVVATGLALFGALTALAVHRGRWGGGTAIRRP